MIDEVRIGDFICKNGHEVILDDIEISVYWRNSGSALCLLYLKNVKTGGEKAIDVCFDFDTNMDTDMGYGMDPNDSGTLLIESLNIYKDIMQYQPNKLNTSDVYWCARKLNITKSETYDLIKKAADALRDSFKADINKQLNEEYKDFIFDDSYDNPYGDPYGM